MKIFKRKIYSKLLSWKKDAAGDCALCIQGARRVGKSTVVEQFARNEYKSSILIDFVSVSNDVRNLFDDLSDLNAFFRMLQFYFSVELVERKSLIVFDEVQLCPKARQAIKILVKDGRYDYIETGSLISIKKNVSGILIPSEERKINMYPMDYEEFCDARGVSVSYEILGNMFREGKSLGDDAARKAMRDFRLYMVTGGMPQAVSALVEGLSFQKIDQIKRGILDLYEEDFRRIDSSGRISDLFDSIPSMLSSGSSRYKVSSVIANQRLDDVRHVLNDLVQSMTVNIAYNVSDPNVGFSLTKDTDHFKLFASDTGLFITLAFKDKSFTENSIYEKLLSDKLPANLGYVYENVVAQMLKANGNELFYHFFPKESSNQNYEVDFLLSRGSKICPIEVKSSGYKTHSSLDAFCGKYSSRVSNRYLVYSKDYRNDGQTTLLPVFLVPFLG